MLGKEEKQSRKMVGFPVDRVSFGIERELGRDGLLLLRDQS